jgi:hypothetical protein
MFGIRNGFPRFFCSVQLYLENQSLFIDRIRLKTAGVLWNNKRENDGTDFLKFESLADNPQRKRKNLY